MTVGRGTPAARNLIFAAPTDGTLGPAWNNRVPPMAVIRLGDWRGTLYSREEKPLSSGRTR